jgi:hypothetical protein
VIEDISKIYRQSTKRKPCGCSGFGRRDFLSSKKNGLEVARVAIKSSIVHTSFMPMRAGAPLFIALRARLGAVASLWKG